MIKKKCIYYCIISFMPEYKIFVVKNTEKNIIIPIWNQFYKNLESYHVIITNLFIIIYWI